MKKIGIVILEIFLMVSISFSFSYILGDAFGGIETVSALEPSDLQNGVYTCEVGNDGSICQSYPASECAEQCQTNCIPAPREATSICEEGTCYSSREGSCTAGATRAECERSGDTWFDDPFENIPQCREGCCILGDETRFGTEGQCEKQGRLLGIEEEFRQDVQNELSCLLLANAQEEGACVFTSGNALEQNDCRFLTKAGCLQSNGDFYLERLCSNPDLETRCEAQSSSNCVEGRGEIYWFDSCGNRENIYSANKVQSFNDGFVLSKVDSCALGTDSNPLRNQGICGNCNYFGGSTCGAKTSNEKLDDSTQDFVCKDLRCEDSEGNDRENGESWCGYQGAIGVDEGAGGKLRSIDTPGSRHFRLTCLDGEIRTDACADYRNEICVEEQTEKAGGGTFSSAACRINKWQQCLEYNTEVTKEKRTQDERDDKCERNPDCFVKEINVDEGFKFNICAPKYPEGFDLDVEADSEAAESLCAFASQKCTVIYVKNSVGDWKCKANCDCEDSGFTQQMNDLCMSLGDCGASVNYQGELSESYRVKGSSKLGRSYLSKIEEYSDYENSPNDFAEVGDISDFYGTLGIPEGLGMAEYEGEGGSNIAGGTSKVTGLIGVSALVATHVVGVESVSVFASFLAGSSAGSAAVNPLSKIIGSLLGGEGGSAAALGANPAWTAAGGALAGAAAGAGAVSLLISLLGVGPGLTKAEASSLIGAGGVAGAVAGAAAAASAGSAASLSAIAAGTKGAIVGAGGATLSVGTAGPVAGIQVTAGAGGASITEAGGATYALAAGESVTATAGSTVTATAGSTITSTAGGVATVTEGAVAPAAAPAGGAGLSAATIAIIAIIIIVVLLVVMKLLGVGDTKKKTVQFTCQPWQAPDGGSSCSKCGQDGFPCSRYACDSLGKTCELVNEGTGEDVCINIAPDDVTAPSISPLDNVLTPGFEYADVSNDGFKIERIDESINEGCVSGSDNLVFGLELNEPGTCRFDVLHTDNFDEMEFDFGINRLLKKNHTQVYNVPNLESLGLPGYDPDRKVDHNLFTRCKDASGNENVREYTINFCVKPGRDLTAPHITSRFPETEWVNTTVSELNASIFTNEPAECKFSLADKDYDLMENEFDCQNDLEDRVLQGWGCEFNLDISEMEEPENRVYVKCKDQPWLIEDNGNGLSAIRVDEGEGNERIVELDERRERNTNTESYQYVIRRSQSGLIIDEILPVDESELRFGVAPGTVNVNVKTSGGVDGTSTCRYAIQSDTYLPLVGDTFVPGGISEHSVPLQLFNGNHLLYVECTDVGGNIASGYSEFSVVLDTQAPRVTRVYDRSGELVLITDESAECSYITGEDGGRANKCKFNFDGEGTTQMNGNEKIHTATFDDRGTYYIKCKDMFDNKPGDCNIVVRQGIA